MSKPGGGAEMSGKLAHSLIEPASFTSPRAGDELGSLEEGESALFAFD